MDSDFELHYRKTPGGANANAFVAQEGMMRLNHTSVRIAGFDLLGVSSTSSFYLVMFRVTSFQTLIDRAPAQTLCGSFQAVIQNDLVSTSE